MIRHTVILALASGLALSACATPETRLRNGLIEAGVAEPTAACIAERMADRLSLLQLKRVGSIASLKDEKLSEMSERDFVYRIRALKDPEILAVATTSAGICSLR